MHIFRYAKKSLTYNDVTMHDIYARVGVNIKNVNAKLKMDGAR